MSAFDLYAAYYDLLYGDKDYAAEAAHVAALLGEGVTEVLELGCGTGGHAAALAARGCRVQGVDLSPGMVQRALVRRAALPAPLQERLQFAQGDLRTYRAARRFDAVLALFHVMSYQTGNDDLLAALRTAREHLRPGGRFVFDFWYGPAVLSDRPRHVEKTVADARIEVRRRTTPTLHPNANRVDVDFDVRIVARDGGEQRTVNERHPMRYLFLPELDLLAGLSGFQRHAACAWMKHEPPDDTTWYASTTLVAA